MDDLVGPPILMILGLLVMGLFAVVAVRSGYIQTRKSRSARTRRLEAKNLPALLTHEPRELSEQVLTEPDSVARVTLPEVPAHIRKLRQSLARSYPSMRTADQYQTRDNAWAVRIDVDGAGALLYMKDERGWFDWDGGLWNDADDTAVPMTLSQITLRVGVDVLLALIRAGVADKQEGLRGEIMLGLDSALSVGPNGPVARGYLELIRSAMRS